MNGAETPLPRRDTARLLIFDPTDRLLLIQYQAARDIDPAKPGQRAFWYTPGGGLEAGENHQQAALRELQEETGIVDAKIGAHIADWTAKLTLFRKHALTFARFYIVRAQSAELDLSQLAITENDPVLDVRWFSAADLAACKEPIIPDGIAALAARIVAGHIPTTPVELHCPLACA